MSFCLSASYPDYPHSLQLGEESEISVLHVDREIREHRLKVKRHELQS